MTSPSPRDAAPCPASAAIRQTPTSALTNLVERGLAGVTHFLHTEALTSAKVEAVNQLVAFVWSEDCGTEGRLLLD